MITAYALLLFTLALVSYMLVLWSAIKLPGLAELGLASTGTASLGAGIGALEGHSPTWTMVILAAVGGIVVALSLAAHYKARCRRCAEQSKTCPIYPVKDE